MFKEGRIVEAGSLSDETVPVSDRRFRVGDDLFSDGLLYELVCVEDCYVHLLLK
jgi:hypothetical protein